MNKPEVKSGRTTSQQSTKKMTREELDKQIRRMRDRDSEKITGIFRNLENRAGGGSVGALVFSYKQYPGDPYEFYELRDGERYSLPRGLARHLSTGCFYREYENLSGEFGKESRGLRTGIPTDGRLAPVNVHMFRKVHRFAFDSLEFMDDDTDLKPSNLLEVTLAP